MSSLKSFADRAKQTFEGGLGNTPFHEAQGTHLIAAASAGLDWTKAYRNPQLAGHIVASVH